MSPTLPFWAGALILIGPAAIMVLAVVDALPRWSGLALFVVLASLPIPAAAQLVADGVRTWRGARIAPGRGPGGPPALASSRLDRIGAALAILLGAALLVGSLVMLAAILRGLAIG